LFEKKAASKWLRHVDDLANISKYMAGIFVFMYIDGILILSPKEAARIDKRYYTAR